MRIKVGKCYIANLTKGEAPVRIESTHEDGGWVARTLLTSRTTRIKTAEQIVRECSQEELDACANQRAVRVAMTPDAPEPPVACPVEQAEVVAEPEAPEIVPDDDIYVRLRSKPRRKMSLLDAAYRVLTEYGDELSASEIVQAALCKGYWETQGKTPGNTLNAALTREIRTKGEAARFTKGSRGHFAARPQ